MYTTSIGRKLHDVLLIVVIKSLGALNWELLSLHYFLWKSFDAAMSKLSFRARALDANKSLPVFHEEDVPDLPDIASVNRVVPQMPTGMEKEEETEHHLQRAISAQQIYGGSQRLIIPTPDAILYDAHYKQLIRRTVHMPKQLIHVQAFTLEDELPDYDCDEEDENWIENYNKKNTDKPINVLDFEKVIDTLEKSCSSRIDLFTLTDAQALVKKDENIVKVLFQYWKEKRLKGKTLTPAVRTEKKDGTALHDPYVAFRRRIEKMQTRKNRKNDESSYEKMLKLRRDLNRACLILEMVKQREEKKKDLLQTTIKILESRYANKDFSGELLHQCFELLKQRQMQQEHKPQPLQPSNMKEHGEHKKRSELIEEQKKRHKLLKQQQRAALLASSEDTELTSHNTHSRESDKSNEGPDGKYTFRRKKGVIYHAPRYDSMGNWPWTHPVEGGSGSSQYSYSKTSILKKCRCIGYARRRVGRGGRVNFDRAYSPYDDISTDKNDFFGSISSSIDERVPPWPHYKPHYDSSSDDEDKSDLTTSIQRLTKELSENCDSKNNVSSNKTTLYRSFSTQPSSRFRIHPYSKRRTSNGQLKKSRSSVNNQVFIAASIAASISKNVDSQSWILRRSNNNHQLFGNRNRKTTFSGSMKNPLTHHLSVSPPRPASTAPASAIYQLNFPITTKVPTASSTNSKVNTTVTNTNVNNNNTILRAIVKTSAQTSLHLNTSSDNSIVRAHSAAGAAALLQTSISRQPLSIVQQQSLIAAQQKIIPQSSVSSIQQGSILQVQPVLSNVRTNKINNIPKGLTINHNTVVSNGITTQPQSIQQLAR